MTWREFNIRLYKTGERLKFDRGSLLLLKACCSELNCKMLILSKRQETQTASLINMHFDIQQLVLTERRRGNGKKIHRPLFL